MKRVALVLIAALAMLAFQATSAASVATDGGSVSVARTDGPLVLEAGDVPGVSAETDELLIDTAHGTAAGVAPSARYTYGATGNPTGAPAFTLRNAAGEAHRLTIEYTGSDTEDPDENVQFRVFGSEGTRLATASEESGPVTLEVEGNDRLYVVVVIDTHGLTPVTDLSGSLRLVLA